MRIRAEYLAFAALASAWPVTARAEATATPFASELKSPTKIILTAGGKLLVSEAGDLPTSPVVAAPFVANHGRVSIVERSGSHWALLEGLPAGLDLDNGNPTGPSGLWISGPQTLYVEIAQGDTIKRVAGGEAPNPQGLSSALFSSLWRIRFGDPIDCLHEGFALSPTTHYGPLADGQEIHLVNPSGEEAWVRVVADLRDLYPAGPPPNVVSGSNPFGLLRLGDDFYLPDAGQNSLVKIDRETGRAKTIVHFPGVPNPPPNPGPPFSQPVPNSIRGLPGHESSALVTLLTGFPFGQGRSSVQLVDLHNGTTQAFISGLTVAIDVLALGRGNGPFLVLEFASGFRLPGQPGGPPGFVPPGRLLRFAQRTSAAEVLSTALTTPTSMAFDRVTRELFVTEIGTGSIVRIQL
jgi:hypothetical protein